MTRSIPAWAGKPPLRRDPDRHDAVHPRVGGETAKGWTCPARRRVHPRVGGETVGYTLDGVPIKGPSPRGRGNPQRAVRYQHASGSIPAWAGKPVRVDRELAQPRVHPRVGGETPSGLGKQVAGCGPSPRGRGNRGPGVHLGVPVGSIPAWAGKPPLAAFSAKSMRVHPRVGGETAARRPLLIRSGGPSPRGRGNRVLVGVGVLGRRSIPAWAGKPAWGSPRC